MITLHPVWCARAHLSLTFCDPHHVKPFCCAQELRCLRCCCARAAFEGEDAAIARITAILDAARGRVMRRRTTIPKIIQNAECRNQIGPDQRQLLA